MEISPINFMGTKVYRKMMTPTKLKEHTRKITLAKITKPAKPKTQTTTYNPLNSKQRYF